MKVGGGGGQGIYEGGFRGDEPFFKVNFGNVLSLAMRAFDAEWHTHTKNLARFARLSSNFLLIKKLQIAYPFQDLCFGLLLNSTKGRGNC